MSNADKISTAIGSGIKTGIYLGREVRRSRQIQLANELNGFDVVDGKYVRNEYGQKLDELKLARTEDLLAIEKEKKAAYDNLLSQQAATSSFKDIATGKANEGWNVAKSHPLVRQQYNNAGIYNVMPVDLHNDKSLLSSANIDVDSMTPQQKNAINSTYVKVFDKNGDPKILSTKELKNRLGAQFSSEFNKNFDRYHNKALQILQGKPVTDDATYNAKQSQLKATTVSNELKSKLAGLQLQAVNDYIDKNPNASAKDILGVLNSSTSKPLTELQKVKLEKAKLDLKEEQKKAEKAAQEPMDIKDEANLISKIVSYNPSKSKDKDEYYRLLDNADKIIKSKIQNKENIKLNTAEKKVIDKPSSVIALNRVKAKIDNLISSKADLKDVPGLAAVSSILAKTTSATGKDYIRLMTQARGALADYVRDISGLTVTDKEYNNLLNIMLGGDYSNLDGMRTALTQFISDIDHREVSQIQGVGYTNPKIALIKLKNRHDKIEADKLMASKKYVPTHTVDHSIHVTNGNGSSVTLHPRFNVNTPIDEITSDQAAGLFGGAK